MKKYDFFSFKKLDISKIKGFVVLEGTDYFLRNSCLDLFKQTINKEALLDISYDSIESATQFLNESSLFSPTKLLILQQVSKFSEDSFALLMSSLEKTPNSIIVFCCDKLDHRKNIIKKLISNSILVDVLPLKEPNLSKVSLAYIKSHSKITITDNLLKYLLSKTGTNLGFIINEINRLLSFKQFMGNITIDDIDNIITDINKTESFQLWKDFLSADRKIILKSAIKLTQQGEHPLALVAMIATLYRQMLQILNQPTKWYGRSDFTKLLNKISFREIKEAFILLSKFDINVKSGLSNPKSLFYFLIIKLTKDM